MRIQQDAKKEFRVMIEANLFAFVNFIRYC